MDKILLSIIIPVYNVGGYIQRCVDSIIQQECSFPLEILLIDDGSTDDSFVRCNQISKTNSIVKTIRQENKGVSSARNRGIAESRGKWIWFIDGDDYLLPNSLKMISNHLDGDNDILAFAYIHEIDETSKRVVLPSEENVTRYSGIHYINTSYSSPTIWSYVFKRSLIQDNNVRLSEKLKYGEDKIFILECLYYAQNIHMIYEPIYEYAYRAESAVNNKNTRIVTDQLESIKVLIKIIHDKKLSVRVFDSQITYILWLYLHLLSSTINQESYGEKEKELYKYCHDYQYWNPILFTLIHFRSFALNHHGGIIKRIVRGIQKYQINKYI